jgi:hypothetical protein
VIFLIGCTVKRSAELRVKQTMALFERPLAVMSTRVAIPIDSAAADRCQMR